MIKFYGLNGPRTIVSRSCGGYCIAGKMASALTTSALFFKDFK